MLNVNEQVEMLDCGTIDGLNSAVSDTRFVKGVCGKPATFLHGLCSVT